MYSYVRYASDRYGSYPVCIIDGSIHLYIQTFAPNHKSIRFYGCMLPANIINDRCHVDLAIMACITCACAAMAFVRKAALVICLLAAAAASQGVQVHIPLSPMYLSHGGHALCCLLALYVFRFSLRSVARHIFMRSVRMMP